MTEARYCSLVQGHSHLSGELRKRLKPSRRSVDLVRYSEIRQARMAGVEQVLDSKSNTLLVIADY
jgi:hypothetical protein